MTQRGNVRRTWVKFYVTGWLHGSIRWQMSPEERSVWADLLCLAGECGKGGKICDNDERPYPMEYIANQLNIPLDLLQRTVEGCKKEGRVEKKDGVIEITNWNVYQSEYERQKKYRQKDDKNPEDYYRNQKYGDKVKR